MPEKVQLTSSSLAELLGQIVEKGYSVNFDVTLEFSTPELKIGSLRMHGRVESASSRKR